MMKVSVCVSAIHACVSCAIGVKLAVVDGGTRGQVLVVLPSPLLQFAESYTSISAFSL